MQFTAFLNVIFNTIFTILSIYLKLQVVTVVLFHRILQEAL